MIGGLRPHWAGHWDATLGSPQIIALKRVFMLLVTFTGRVRTPLWQTHPAGTLELRSEKRPFRASVCTQLSTIVSSSHTRTQDLLRDLSWPVHDQVPCAGQELGMTPIPRPASRRCFPPRGCSWVRSRSSLKCLLHLNQIQGPSEEPPKLPKGS